ncbi:RNA polymerase subunit sigma-24 [Bacillus canaveralius]|uniref:RNA polymerase subunit sigma-24 n=1 Tax=Bacillus canaveralius TaxID=1403243 RepID=A0A2N5GIC5_9BACI|nr:sigma-70 family RNA polymerase sigma factor [Bacillus canaveralius]PLR80628.1 RNA polymerase subunit sigma-24 [Bacillus canaveralius]PLR88532.1 RNA polymerase subunit sigma-24 [Bacillus canaveralius]RSK54154.1 sigma-70 family RNA polymerase sigma factor [Bacillus canaveralius]
MESFEQLVEQYNPMIHKVIHSLNIYKNEEEFYQIALIGLWEAKQRFNPEKGLFLNYAYTYIKGKLLSELAKNVKNEERSVYPKEEFWELIEDLSSDRPLERKLLLSYCEPLTEKQTKWVLYTYLDGLTIKEIAEKESVSVSAVKAWRKGAKEIIKDHLTACNL